MFTVVMAWLAVLALCVAATLLGRTARTGRRPTTAQHAGRFLSRSGPGLAVGLAVALGAGTGAWLPAAAVGAVAVTGVAVAGLVLAPR
ncbi:MAG TPA: hypothetical protein VD834_05890 [Blastococcus sp.]|nr:hypothetical protein [Blastococcus sp.]